MLRSTIRTSGLVVAIATLGCDDASVDPAGARVFTAYCAACHQKDGGGTEGGPPPLLGSSWVDGSPPRIIRVVLHGLRGEIEVAGRTYNLEMPGFGAILKNEEIAAVLTYVRDRFGSADAKVRVVTPAAVAAIRTEHADRSDYWTVEELERMPETR